MPRPLGAWAPCRRLATRKVCHILYMELEGRLELARPVAQETVFQMRGGRCEYSQTHLHMSLHFDVQRHTLQSTNSAEVALFRGENLCVRDADALLQKSTFLRVAQNETIKVPCKTLWRPTKHFFSSDDTHTLTHSLTHCLKLFFSFYHTHTLTHSHTTSTSRRRSGPTSTG